jgi:cytochrome bd-type quinol oxidase subunit 2
MIRRLLSSLMLVSVLLSPMLMPRLSLAACSDSNLSTQDAIQCGTNAAGGTSDSTKATSNVHDTLISIIRVLSLVAGAIAVVMIIIGGFRFITSGGNAESTKSARNTITYAIVGLIVIALAQIIVHFTLNTVVNNCVNNKTPSGQSC